MSKIKEFTDLKIWQEGHRLLLFIYKITEKFPKRENCLLIDQMRRSAASITANIAEGFGRHSYKEKIQFYYLSQGSLTELKNHIFITKDVGYLSTEDFNLLITKVNETHKLLQGLIVKSKIRLNS